jgi:hypothetical protein
MKTPINPPLLIKYFVLGVLAVLGILKAAEADWHALFMIGQTIFFSMIPTFLKRMYGIRTPHILQAGVVIFMFATIFLGEVNHFYERFPWWDLVFHTLAGLGFGLVGYAILILTYRQQNVRLAPLFTSVFAVSFSIAVSVLWEILEFFADMFLGTTMQPSSTDTMWDLIVCTIGALVAAYSGYRYIIYSESVGMNKIIDDAVQKNT